jgi:hypothetical protein
VSMHECATADREMCDGAVMLGKLKASAERTHDGCVRCAYVA